MLGKTSGLSVPMLIEAGHLDFRGSVSHRLQLLSKECLRREPFNTVGAAGVERSVPKRSPRLQLPVGLSGLTLLAQALIRYIGTTFRWKTGTSG